MAKLTRYFQKLFASNAGTNQIAEFGSLAASTPMRYSGATVTPALIQGLGNFLTGWTAAQIGSGNPTVEDDNALNYLWSYQLCYLLQQGIAEWDATTVYYTGSFVNANSSIYVSRTDNNTNHAVTDNTNWRSLINYSGSQASPNSVGGATAVPVAAGLTTDVYVKGNAGTWVARTLGASAWQSVCWAPQISLFCAVSSTSASSGNIATSPDGITWTTRSGPTTQAYGAVAWSPYLNLFIATGGQSGKEMASSPDGITWTTRTSGDNTKIWSAIAWSPQQRIFVAVATTGTNFQSSGDGVTWTLRATGSSTAYHAVTWSDQLGIFVAVGTSSTVLISYDGINWKSFNSQSGDWRGIVWADTLGLFVAVSVATNYVQTSPDGMVWTLRTPAFSDEWQSIAWAHELGLLIAMDNQVGSSQAMTSPDGINWTSQTVAENNNWSSIAYANSLNTFAAVANSLSVGTHYAQNLPSSAITASPAIANGVTQSERLTVIGSDDMAAVVMNTGTGVALQRQVILKKNQTARFLWDNAQAMWIQV